MNKKDLYLKEKEKIESIYGVTDKQLYRYVGEALKERNPGEHLLQKLETRLDNIVYRLGFSSDRKQAEELILHGHIAVDGQRVDIPVYHVKQREVITIEKDVFESPHIQEIILNKKPGDLPPWLFREANFGKIIRIPDAHDMKKFAAGINADYVVSYYLAL